MNLNRSGQRRWGPWAKLVWPLLSALVLLGLLVAAVLLALAQRARSADTVPPTTVEILSPISGERLVAGDEQAVLLWGTASDEIVRFELWVDGVLEQEAEIGPTETSTALGRTLTWRPGKPGASVLIARVSDRLGRVATSGPRVVDVLPRAASDPLFLSYEVLSGDSASGLARTFGIPEADLAAANPGMPPMPPPGTEIRIPLPVDRLPEGYLGDDIRHGPAETGDPLPDNLGEARRFVSGEPGQTGDVQAPPGPSSFEAASSGDCGARLSWADVSDSEDFFRVYRLGGVDASFTQIADLAPNSEFEGLTYEDHVPLAGTYEYFVAARNGVGEGASPIRRVVIPEGGCPPGGAELPSGAISLLQLEILNLTTSGAADRPYCYFSHQLAGDGYVRLPAGEDTFLEPDEDGWNIEDYAGASHGTVFVANGDAPIPVAMECWAWRGDQVVSLGSFRNSHPRSEWEAQPAPQFTGIGEGFRAVYSILPIRLDRTLLYEIDCPSRDDQMTNPSGSAAVCDSSIPAPYNVRRPGDDLPEGAQPSALAQECGEGHIDVAGGTRRDGAAYAGLACILPEHVAIWEWDGDPAAIEGYQVSFDYARPSSPYYGHAGRRSHHTYTIGSMAQLYWIPRNPQCEETLTIRAFAFEFESYPDDAEHPRQSEGGWVPDPPQDYFIRTSPNSDPYFVYGPACPHQAQARLVLGRLQVDHSRDVDGLEALCFFCEEDHTQEAYGVLRFDLEAADGTRQEVAVIHFWDADDPRSIHNGDYPLEDEEFEICKVDQGILPVTRQCRQFPSEVSFPGFVMFVEEGQRLVATLVLQDWDGSTGDDVWCNGVAHTARYTARGWAEADLGMYVDNSEALFREDEDVYCYVDMHIEGLGVTGGETTP